jgi:hypothetical protein
MRADGARTENASKTGWPPGGGEKEDSGRKHLTRLEVEKLIDAAVGYSRRREARDIADSIEESNRRIAGRHVW